MHVSLISPTRQEYTSTTLSEEAGSMKKQLLVSPAITNPLAVTTDDHHQPPVDHHQPRGDHRLEHTNTHANTWSLWCQTLQCFSNSVLQCVLLNAGARFSRRDIVASIPTTRYGRASPQRVRLGLRELFSPLTHARLHTDRVLMHGPLTR